MLCSGLWRHSKVFDSPGPNLQSKNYLGPNGRNGSWGTQNVHFFRQKFLQAVPLGANTFRWGEWSKKGRKGPKCVPKQVWTSYDTPILRFCILSEKKNVHFPPGIIPISTAGGVPNRSHFLSLFWLFLSQKQLKTGKNVLFVKELDDDFLSENYRKNVNYIKDYTFVRPWFVFLSHVRKLTMIPGSWYIGFEHHFPTSFSPWRGGKMFFSAMSENRRWFLVHGK